MTAAVADPDLKNILAQMSPSRMEAEQLRSKLQLQRAMQEGHWQPVLDDIRQQGGHYARIGLPFSSWFLIVTAAQKAILERLFEAYSKDPAGLQRIVLALNKWLFDISLARIGEQYLDTREHVIKQQQQAIKELSTPVLPVRSGLLLLPIIGVIDSERARQLTEQLLEGIRTHRAKAVVIDLTGVPAVDSAVANHLLQTVRAAKLLGANAVITGISTENAQTLTRIGVDLSGLLTTSDLQSGIDEAEWLLQVARAHRESAANGLHAQQATNR
ncbi:STAS domain-containing protein [bacterium]|nr:MAG: STAS domain-containing protein [bacterium]